MKTHPLVSLVVPSYDGKDMAIKLLESLKKLKYKNFEVVLVDNGSVDGTYEHIRKHYPYVKALKIKKNRGFTGGANFGIRQAKGDYIVIMNNDMTVDPNWLTELVEVANSDSKIGIVGSALLNEHDVMDRLGYVETGKIILRFHRLHGGERHRKSFPKVMDVDFTFGLTKREVIEKTGLLDEKYFLYWEDVELCYAAKRAGYKIVVAPHAKLWHGGAVTTNRNLPLKTFHFYKNKIRFIMKNLGFVRKLVNIPLVLGNYTLQCLKHAAKGEFAISFAIVRAVFWNIKNFRDYI